MAALIASVWAESRVVHVAITALPPPCHRLSWSGSTGIKHSEPQGMAKCTKLGDMWMTIPDFGANVRHFMDLIDSSFGAAALILMTTDRTAKGDRRDIGSTTLAARINVTESVCRHSERKALKPAVGDDAIESKGCIGKRLYVYKEQDEKGDFLILKKLSPVKKRKFNLFMSVVRSKRRYFIGVDSL